MTRDEILALKPGSKLDLLVCEKVMKWITPWEPFFPSTDIAAAREVVEKMRNSEWGFTLKSHKEIFGTLYNAFTSTVPEAICKAALLAVMGKWR